MFSILFKKVDLSDPDSENTQISPPPPEQEPSDPKPTTKPKIIFPEHDTKPIIEPQSESLDPSSSSEEPSFAKMFSGVLMSPHTQTVLKHTGYTLPWISIPAMIVAYRRSMPRFQYSFYAIVLTTPGVLTYHTIRQMYLYKSKDPLATKQIYSASALGGAGMGAVMGIRLGIRESLTMGLVGIWAGLLGTLVVRAVNSFSNENPRGFWMSYGRPFAMTIRSIWKDVVEWDPRKREPSESDLALMEKMRRAEQRLDEALEEGSNPTTTTKPTLPDRPMSRAERIKFINDMNNK